MNKQFQEYYRPKLEEFPQKFRECIFIFDTNVLLNLYRYTTESRDNLIKVLQAIKERVWLPHQVGLEYQRNRVDVLLGQLGLSAKLDGMICATIEEVEKINRSSLFTVNALIETVKTDLIAINQKLQQKKEQKPDLMTGDPIFDAITQIFDGKVGMPYKPEEYINIYKKGKERYEAEVPPGYKDKSKNPNDTDQYGDLLVWLQVIDYAKSVAQPIILITDDAKEDWWREVRGEKLGPRPELLKEYLAETGGDKWFYMYSTEQFLKHAKEYLDMDVTPKAIEEAEGIEKEDAEQEKIRMTFATTIDMERANRERERRRAIAFERFKKEHDDSAVALEWLKNNRTISDSVLERFRRNRIIGSNELERFKQDSNYNESDNKQLIKFLRRWAIGTDSQEEEEEESFSDTHDFEPEE